jgi:SpoVK/Ycf46/Vps4 family AAA+-type ATPase
MSNHLYSYTDAELAKELREIAERGHTVRGKPDAAWFMRQAADALERARGPNGEAKYTMADLELFCQRAALAAIEQYEPALRRLIAASDQFVKDTGLKHGDLITDAVEAARPLLLEASPSATHEGGSDGTS